jgi:hypothetical protein
MVPLPDLGIVVLYGGYPSMIQDLAHVQLSMFAEKKLLTITKHKSQPFTFTYMYIKKDLKNFTTNVDAAIKLYDYSNYLRVLELDNVRQHKRHKTEHNIYQLS